MTVMMQVTIVFMIVFLYETNAQSGIKCTALDTVNNCAIENGFDDVQSNIAGFSGPLCSGLPAGGSGCSGFTQTGYFYGYHDVSLYEDIKLVFDQGVISLTPSGTTTISYDCDGSGTWIQVTADSMDVTDDGSSYTFRTDVTYSLPAICDNNANVGIRIDYVAGEWTGFKNICITGSIKKCTAIDGVNNCAIQNGFDDVQSNIAGFSGPLCSGLPAGASGCSGFTQTGYFYGYHDLSIYEDIKFVFDQGVISLTPSGTTIVSYDCDGSGTWIQLTADSMDVTNDGSSYTFRVDVTYSLPVICYSNNNVGIRIDYTAGEWTGFKNICINSYLGPTPNPTSEPTPQPTPQPTTNPTSQPTPQPTSNPTQQPTSNPTSQPTRNPTSQPTVQPTSNPTSQPTFNPTSQPTRNPTVQPTTQPTSNPSIQPSDQPTNIPTFQPSENPSIEPTIEPTLEPTLQPITIISTESATGSIETTQTTEATKTITNEPDPLNDNNNKSFIKDNLVYLIVGVMGLFICCLLLIILTLVCNRNKKKAVKDEAEHYKHVQMSSVVTPVSTDGPSTNQTGDTFPAPTGIPAVGGNPLNSLDGVHDGEINTQNTDVLPAPVPVPIVPVNMVNMAVMTDMNNMNNMMMVNNMMQQQMMMNNMMQFNNNNNNNNGSNVPVFNSLPLQPQMGIIPLVTQGSDIDDDLKEGNNDDDDTGLYDDDDLYQDTSTPGDVTTTVGAVKMICGSCKALVSDGKKDNSDGNWYCNECWKSFYD